MSGEAALCWLAAWLVVCGLLAAAALLQDWRARQAEPLAVALVRWILIGAAIALAPLYGLWLAGGRLADRLGQRRHK